MLTPKGYTTIQAIENYLLTDISDCFQPQVLEWIAQMEKYIENYTGRVFIEPTTATAKYYDGNGECEMVIDEFTTISSVSVNGTLIDAANYVLYPLNDERKNKIKLLYTLFYPVDPGDIIITAKWAYSKTVPYDLQWATTVLVSGIIQYSNDTSGEVQSESLGNYSVSYKDEKHWQDLEKAKEILDFYKLYNF